MRRLIPLLLALLVAAPALGAPPLAAQVARTVTVHARCELGPGAVPSEVAVTITNRTGAPLRVGYVRSLAVPSVVYPPGVADLDVFDDPVAVRVPRLEDEGGGGYPPGALVVTNAGVLAVECERGAIAGTTEVLALGPAPATAAAAREEAVRIAAETIAELERRYAFDALYALLHPDAQREVAFQAVACWYYDEFAPAITPGEVEIIGLAFGAWTWGVNGVTYPDAAEVAYRQVFRHGTGYGEPRAEVREATQHLVLADRQWRWFFGGDRAWLASLRTDCGLRIA